MLALLLLLPAPYAELAEAPPLRMIVSPATEAPELWTQERITEAADFARGHLARCNIKLEVGPLKVLMPGDESDPTRLWRTPHMEEFAVVLRDPDDRRLYAMAGVADLRRSPLGKRRWLGQAPWSKLVMALAQILGAEALPSWPEPKGAGSRQAMSLAQLAMAFALARGWLNMNDMTIPQAHCERMRGRLKKLNDAPRARLRAPPDALRGRGLRLETGATPLELLLADVPNRDAITLAIRDRRGWLLTSVANRRRAAPRMTLYPGRHGRGVALARVGGASLLVTELEGRFRAAWLHADPKRKADFRGDRWLPCSKVLAVDAVPPDHMQYGAGDPGVALVVCSDRVLQLSPLKEAEERWDPIEPGKWASLTRWGPARARLLVGGARPRVYTIGVREPPAPLPVPPQIGALLRERPNAPIWHRPPAAPVQLTGEALYGLGAPRRFGKGVQAWLQPNLYRSLRRRGTELRTDSLYEGPRRSATLAEGALVAMHGGDYAPFVLSLEEGPRGWRVRSPLARPDTGGRAGFRACYGDLAKSRLGGARAGRFLRSSRCRAAERWLAQHATYEDLAWLLDRFPEHGRLGRLPIRLLGLVILDLGFAPTEFVARLVRRVEARTDPKLGKALRRATARSLELLPGPAARAAVDRLRPVYPHLHRWGRPPPARRSPSMRRAPWTGGCSGSRRSSWPRPGRD